jgi:uncharacterized protein YndB with AHSA1/START domain
MSTQTEIPSDRPVIIMTRVYDAPRPVVWDAMTDPAHVVKWWGGPGFTNPVCEMDVRPGGLWNHVMRFPDGYELHMHFVFVLVDAPRSLAWRHVDHGKRKDGPPTSETTVTLEAVSDDRTRYTMVARFGTVADRDAAVAMGVTKPIEASNERLTEYLKAMPGRRVPPASVR